MFKRKKQFLLRASGRLTAFPVIGFVYYQSGLYFQVVSGVQRFVSVPCHLFVAEFRMKNPLLICRQTYTLYCVSGYLNSDITDTSSEKTDVKTVS